jgi:hypothetical protein
LHYLRIVIGSALTAIGTRQHLSDDSFTVTLREYFGGFRGGDISGMGVEEKIAYAAGLHFTSHLFDGNRASAIEALSCSIGSSVYRSFSSSLSSRNPSSKLHKNEPNDQVH